MYWSLFPPGDTANFGKGMFQTLCIHVAGYYTEIIW